MILPPWRRLRRRGFALVCGGMMAGGSLPAQTAAPYAGGVLRQTFDGLPVSGEFVLGGKGPFALSDSPFSGAGLTGWQVYANAGPVLRFRIGDGTSSTASTYAFGMPGDSDRALGSIASSYISRTGLLLQNQTGTVLQSFTLDFAVEQWRFSGATAPNQFSFFYRIDSSPPDLSSTSGHVQVPDLGFASPVIAGDSGARNGNLDANRVRVSHRVTGITWPAGHFLLLRWQDVNESGGLDDGLALDDVHFFADTGSSAAPALQGSLPADGAALVLPGAKPRLVFDRPVTLASGAVTLTGSVSGVVAATLQGGPIEYHVLPSSDFAAGETVSLSVIAAQVTSVGAGTPMASGETVTFTVLPDPASTTLPIHAVQGKGAVSPVLGGEVAVQGVVTGVFQGGFPALGGFFLQQESPDADPETSEGLWIYDADVAVPVAVAVGDRVRVRGVVEEFEGMTEIDTPSEVQILGSATVPASGAALLPATTALSLERFEGMKVAFGQTLHVTSNEELGRRGEVEVSSGGALVSATEEVDPNDHPASGTSITGSSNVPAVLARQAMQRLNRLAVDDGSIGFYPDPTPHLGAAMTRRVGDTVTGLAGWLAQTQRGYRVHPAVTPAWVDANPRPAAPVREGRLRVASFNVLNYFTTLNQRGADSASELTRQRDKIVSALTGLDADVLGLLEIENQPAALADLLAALNGGLSPADQYVLLADPATGPGGDAIRLALLYRSGEVAPVGPAVSDSDPVWNTPDPLRPPLIQVFEEAATGERFILCLNHFKSKGSAPTSQTQQLNFAQGDGQAAWNALRRQQAQRLVTLLTAQQSQWGEQDVIVMGDLNAYGEEDPIDLLRAAGYLDQSFAFEPDGYSYSRQGLRGRLDHALATPTLASQMQSVRHWNINADEPAYLDYNEENKSASQLLVNVSSPYRSSDHDPVVVDLDLSPQPTDYPMWVASIEWPVGADTTPTGDPDFDARTNLEEFVARTDPLRQEVRGEEGAGADGSDFILRYRRRVGLSGVLVQPMWSSDLNQWHPMGAPAVVETPEFGTELLEARQPLEGATFRFGRLRITLP